MVTHDIETIWQLRRSHGGVGQLCESAAAAVHDACHADPADSSADEAVTIESKSRRR